MNHTHTNFVHTYSWQNENEIVADCERHRRIPNTYLSIKLLQILNILWKWIINNHHLTAMMNAIQMKNKCWRIDRHSCPHNILFYIQYNDHCVDKFDVFFLFQFSNYEFFFQEEKWKNKMVLTFCKALFFSSNLVLTWVRASCVWSRSFSTFWIFFWSERASSSA